MLRDQARTNELRIAWVRLAALGATWILDSSIFFLGQKADTAYASGFPFIPSLMAAAWFAVGTVLLIALQRGWYRDWLQQAAPLLDGVIIITLFFNIYRIAPDVAEVKIVNFAAACTLYATTGALRFNATAVALTTSIAVLVFAIIGSMVAYPPVEIVFSCSLIAAAGLLTKWLAEMSQRALKSEVGKRTLSRFLPRKVVDDAHSAPMELIGNPQSTHATVMVTDIRNFTRFSETRAPDVVLDFLSQVQGRLAKITTENGGTVDKFLGDGMLAVFGATESLQDHAACAVRAALAMQQAVAELSKNIDVELNIGIGIHSGQVVCGCLGSEDRLEFTVVGDTVNVASRLEALTKEKQVPIIVSGPCVAAMGEQQAQFDLHALGTKIIRGKCEPMALHCIR